MRVQLFTNNLNNSRKTIICNNQSNKNIYCSNIDLYTQNSRLAFTGKSNISQEEIQKYKEIAVKSKLTRKFMPASLQFFYSGANISNFKPQDIKIIKDKIQNDELWQDNKEFQQSLLDNISSMNIHFLKEIKQQELSILKNMLQGTSDDNSILSKLIRKTINELPINVSNENKIKILIKANELNIDSAVLKEKLLPAYLDLIEFSKKNKESLTEPVQETLSDEKIDEYFDANISKIIPAIAVIGSDSLKLRLTQRLKKFDKTLASIEELSKNTEIFDELSNINDRYDKHDNYAPIKFIELLYGLSKLGVSADDIHNKIKSFFTKTGYQVDKLSKEFITKLIESTGYTLQNQEWDYENIYTIPSFLNNGSQWHKEQLLKLISIPNTEECLKFIHNPNTEFGEANNRTKTLFEKYGLDYDSWLHFNQEQNEEFINLRLANLKEKTMYKSKINPFEKLIFRLWKRNPSFDLFQGTTASQCIALDGMNCNAGIDELLYTYAQLLELFNQSQNKSMGNACLYWIQNSNNQKGLLIDSVSVKKDYAFHKNIRNNFFELAKKYARAVSGNPEVKVYIGDHFNKFHIEDLPLSQEKEFKIIGDTNNKKVYLDAIVEKDASSRYVNIDEDKIFNMRLREIK